MGDPELKEVRFDIYCASCRYHERHEYYDPCTSCMEIAMREGTEKPEYYEKKGAL